MQAAVAAREGGSLVKGLHSFALVFAALCACSGPSARVDDSSDQGVTLSDAKVTRVIPNGTLARWDAAWAGTEPLRFSGSVSVPPIAGGVLTAKEQQIPVFALFSNGNTGGSADYSNVLILPDAGRMQPLTHLSFKLWQRHMCRAVPVDFTGDLGAVSPRVLPSKDVGELAEYSPVTCTGDDGVSHDTFAALALDSRYPKKQVAGATWENKVVSFTLAQCGIEPCPDWTLDTANGSYESWNDFAVVVFPSDHKLHKLEGDYGYTLTGKHVPVQESPSGSADCDNPLCGILEGIACTMAIFTAGGCDG
jgi:hypothetical protein